MSPNLSIARSFGAQLRYRWGYLTLVLMLSLGACGINLFSLNDDVNFGKETDRTIRATPQQYPILQNEEIRSYVQGIVNKVVQSPAIQYRGKFPYTVTIINDDKTINAFCTPGGYIYVYTGILRFLDNEAALAGVLAHEVAHAEERHGTQHMTTALGADVALQVALGKNPTQLATMAGNAAVLLGTLKNSRSDELEADTRSFEYLRSTPYYPGSIKFFFEKMMSRGGQTASLLDQWTATHPTSEDRVDNINKLLKESNATPPTPANLFAESYRKAMRSLR